LKIMRVVIIVHDDIGAFVIFRHRAIFRGIMGEICAIFCNILASVTIATRTPNFFAAFSD
jgi:hypothetical protein